MPLIHLHCIGTGAPDKPDQCVGLEGSSEGGGRGKSRGSEAMMVRIRGTTCDMWRSKKPIMRAIEGIRSALAVRQPRLALVEVDVVAAAVVPMIVFTIAIDTLVGFLIVVAVVFPAEPSTAAVVVVQPESMVGQYPASPSG